MRRPDWIKRAAENIVHTRELPFSWGTNDCCLFAARHVDVVRGSAFYDALQTRYHDEASAQRFLASYKSLEAAVNDVFGQESQPGEWGIAGDVVLVVQPVVGETLGIIFGNLIICAGRSGLMEAPLTAALRSWRV